MKAGIKTISKLLFFSLVIFCINSTISVNAQFYSLKEIGTLSFNGEAFDIKVDNEIAYITVMGEDKLKIIDVSNQSTPVELGSFQAQAIHNVFIKNSIAFLCDFNSGLFLLNISLPSNPTIISTFATDGSAWDVQIVDHTAFVADFEKGLLILNISDVNSPSEIGRIAGKCSSVKVVDSYAYVIDFDTGLRIIDITDENNPIQLGIYDKGAPFQTVNAYNNLVYLSDWDEGVKIIDVSDPTTPRKIGSFNSLGNTDYVYLNNHIACVAAWDNGVKLFNISESSKPKEIGEFNDGGKVGKTFMVGETIYVADQQDGLEILRMEVDTSKTTGIMVGTTLIAIIVIQILRIYRKKTANLRQGKQKI